MPKKKSTQDPEEMPKNDAELVEDAGEVAVEDLEQLVPDVQLPPAEEDDDAFVMSEAEEAIPTDIGNPLDIPATPAELVNDTEAKGRIALTPFERQSIAEEYEAARHSRQSAAMTVGAFVTSCRTRQIMRGVISTVEDDGQNVYWIIYEGPVTVRIPFENAYITLPDDLKTAGPAYVLDGRRAMLAKNIGVTIDYVALEMTKNEDNSYSVRGSRVAAVIRSRRRYFGARAVVPTNVGDVIDAQVFSVSPHAVRLYTRGHEVTIRKQFLSYKFIDDAREHFKPGEHIRVKVTSLTDSETGAFKLDVSTMEVEKDGFQELYHRIKSDTITLGTVCSIRLIPGTDKLRITGFMDSLGLPFFADVTNLNYRDTVVSGAKVLVRLYGTVNYRTGYARVEIRSVL